MALDVLTRTALRSDHESGAWPFKDEVHPLTALIYDDKVEAERALRAIADQARAKGAALGGVLPEMAPSRGGRCDMMLRDLFGGELVRISEDRGALARGCRLDRGGLARVCALILSSLPHCDLVLLNKFGVAEVEGGGFRCVISDALTLGVPTIVAVPRRNLADWRAFAGDLAREREVSAAQAG